MIKILFICHGNICRSPMAEFILKDMVARRGLAARFEIASAATSTEEIWNGVGNPVYPPAREELARHGIRCDGKRAVQLKKSDYDYYDYLIGMDTMNIRNMERMTRHKRGEHPDKILLLLEYAGRADSITDPWYSGDFEAAYRDVVEGCEALLRHMEETGILS
ncbi:MAG: low molecular weight phosphotyrosine protein phosphatase [Roseburia sp.]|nr:low molecular weight phosphotyrosine protein phosphatase [Roseburia sp.]